jgi:hypothetical protein
VRADQIFHRTRHVLDRHVGVDAVLVVQIDDVGLETFERTLYGCPDLLRATIEDRLYARVPEVAELGADHHPVAEGCKRFA